MDIITVIINYHKVQTQSVMLLMYLPLEQSLDHPAGSLVLFLLLLLACSSEMLAPTIMCSTDRSSSREIMLSPSKSYMLKATRNNIPKNNA